MPPRSGCAGSGTLACRAYWTALDGRPGPVHLNFPLREPLVLDEPLPGDDTGARRRTPVRDLRAAARSRSPTDGPGPHPSGRLLIVAGARHARAFGGWPSSPLAAGIPLLADPLSGARRGEAAVAHYDLLLRDRAFARRTGPEFVFRLGDLPTSKPLRAWLAGLTDAAQIAIDPDGALAGP